MKHNKLFILLLVKVFLLKGITGCAQPNKAEVVDMKPEEDRFASGTLTNLGPQVMEADINGSTFLIDKSGHKWIYTVETGKPARLLGYNQETSQLLINLPIVGSTGTWALTESTDGWLYIASNQGNLYRHLPGSQTVENLGKALPSETYIWDLVPGKDGEIFGSTSPGARVFRYHPTSGFSDVGNGPILASESYVRSLVYHASTDKLYAGIGSHTGLFEIDSRTGVRKEILPPEDRGHSGFVYYLGLVTGLDGGDRLLATITGTSSNNKTLVYNLRSGKYEEPIANAIAKTAIKSPSDQKIYYTTASTLWSYEITQSGTSPKFVNSNKSALASSWSNDKELSILTSDAKMIKVDVSTSKQLSAVSLEVPPLPIQIQTTALGGDGRIWTSGYPVGSNAAYDPETGKTKQYFGLPQAESISYQGQDIFFGIYGGAKIYRYNTSLPWSIEGSNPKLLGQIAGQDRPFGNLSIPAMGKMFFGTVPSYGTLGGALVEYDLSTEKLTSYPNFIPNHSLVSLAYSGNEIIGGTSVWGGLGIQPIANESKLFGVNPLTKEKTFEIVPVTGAKAITYLMSGPDRNVWGMADGTLFVFNPATSTVVSTHELFEVSEARKTSHVWKNASLLLHPTGRIFGVAYGEFFELDPITKAKKVISENASFSLTMDLRGNLYFNYGENLWKYTP